MAHFENCYNNTRVAKRHPIAKMTFLLLNLASVVTISLSSLPPLAIFMFCNYNTSSITPLYHATFPFRSISYSIYNLISIIPNNVWFLAKSIGSSDIH